MSNDQPRTGFVFTKENMARDVRPEHWWHKGLQLTKAQILEAMANTRSNQEAARWLGITDVTYKKYAKLYTDDETGKTLWEKHKNVSGRGVPKLWSGSTYKKTLDEMLVQNQEPTGKRIAYLKEMLMKDGRLGYQCSACKYGEKRLTDMKAPILLNFKNGNKSDWRIENIQWLCYNCYFLFIGDLYNKKMMATVESMPLHSPEIRDDVMQVYQLDDFYYDHLRKLGLEGEGDVLFRTDDVIDYKDPEDDLIDFKK